MENKEIIKKLRETTNNPNISLPSSINFNIENKILKISLSDKGVCANMQTNESAFEGWAMCLKAWLPELVEQVSICWNIFSIKDDDLHYERFKYRVWKFIETYKWAENGTSFTYDYYKDNLKNWVVNFPLSIAKEDVKEEEAILEREFIDKYNANFDFINQQLPVGIFDETVSKDSSIMPRGKSQIDIWAIKDKVLHIFELKKNNNIMVGIISELMYYVNIMNDIKNNRISYPIDAEKSAYRGFNHLYTAFNQRMISSIEGHFLASELHPLISSDVINLINDSHLLKMEQITYSHTAL